MVSPIAQVLVRVFAYRFYKANAGLFLFLFVTVVLSFFFMNVLNETHLLPAERILYNLIFVLAVITSPEVSLLVFVGWLLYTIKSWSFIMAQSLLPEQQFLGYSVTSSSRVQQFKDWSAVQFVLSLPVLVYGVFAWIVGMIYGHYLIPALLTLYSVALIVLSAGLYVWHMNRRVDDRNRSWVTRFARGWKKPLFSLYLYQLFYSQKFTWIVTKLLSWVVMVEGVLLLGNPVADIRMGGIIMLLVAVTHVVILYQWHYFETTQLAFLRNFPIRRSTLYFNTLLAYLLLTLPETIWLMAQDNLPAGLLLAVFNLGLAMFFRSILYTIDLAMARFITPVFYSFILFFLAILANLLWLLVPCVILFSAVIFYNYYYRSSSGGLRSP